MRSPAKPEGASEILGTGWSVMDLFQQLSRGLARLLLIRPEFRAQPLAAPLAIERRDPLAWWNGQSSCAHELHSPQDSSQY